MGGDAASLVEVEHGEGVLHVEVRLQTQLYSDRLQLPLQKDYVLEYLCNLSLLNLIEISNHMGCLSLWFVLIEPLLDLKRATILLFIAVAKLVFTIRIVQGPHRRPVVIIILPLILHIQRILQR